jgi:hypothetical protein
MLKIINTSYDLMIIAAVAIVIFYNAKDFIKRFSKHSDQDQK